MLRSLFFLVKRVFVDIEESTFLVKGVFVDTEESTFLVKGVFCILRSQPF